MVHLWQHRDPKGNPSRNGYHNRQWARKMREIGLTPTDDGTPTGRDTGQKVTHLIAHPGRFADACEEFIDTNTPELYHDPLVNAPTNKRKAASKTKYTYPACGNDAWAKPDMNIWCGDCTEPMEAAQPPDENEEES
jgi:hypothetical protein